MVSEKSLEAVYDARPWTKLYPNAAKVNSIQLDASSLPEMASHAIKKYANRNAFSVCLDNGLSASLTYQDVEDLSNNFAAYLSEVLGFKKGDRVAIQLPNCLAYPICTLGIMKAGCIVVNVNPLYTEKEMVHQLNDAGVRMLLILDMFGDKLTYVLPKTKIEHAVLVSVADLFPFHLNLLVNTVLKIKKKIPAVRVHHKKFKNTIEEGKPHTKAFLSKNPLNALASTDIAVLQYTGGTTGVSKGAVLTHGNIMSNISQSMLFLSDKLKPEQEVVITALPLYHIFAFSLNFFLFFKIGAHNVLTPSPRPISNLKKAFEKFEFSCMTGVNTLYNALINEEWFRNNLPKKLKLSVAGGAALHVAVAEQWEKLTGVKLIEGFGLTESSPVLSFNPVDGKSDKIGTIGIPVPGTELRIVDDEGRAVPQGEPGELIARGPQVMKGYWEKPEETAKTIKDGWLYTGDVAVMDQQGFFKIVDRKKDMILVSGFNVYPNEVEDCLAKHPSVAEVAVIGVPDAQSGEAVAAYIVAKPNATVNTEEIRKHCKESLVAYKVPRKVEVRTDLPKSPIGKILRRELRQQVMQQRA